MNKSSLTSTITNTQDANLSIEKAALKRVRWLTLLINFCVLMAGLNESLAITWASFFDFTLVLWREVISLTLVVPIISLLCFEYMLSLNFQHPLSEIKKLLHLMVLSLILISVGMGVHEPFSTGMPHLTGDYRSWVYFYKELFSHSIFFLGVIGCCLAVALNNSRNAFTNTVTKYDIIFVLISAAIGGGGIFFSLMRGHGIIDLVVLFIIALSSEIIRKRRSAYQVPFIVAIELCFTLGLVLLILYNCKHFFI